MLDKGSVFYLVAVILTCRTLSCEGCTCVDPPFHIQTALCQNEFVIKAAVKSRDPRDASYEVYDYDDDGFRQYQVKVKHTFKLPTNFTTGSLMTIKSGIGSAMCGVLLDVGKTYLLGGYLMDNGDLYLESCSSVIASWDSLADTTKHLLHRGKYLKGCDCKIKPCFSALCKKQARNTCFYDVRAKTSDCYAESTFCRRRQNSKTCRWIKGAGLKDCLRKERLLNATKQ